MDYKYTNHLVNEKSPYLLQHAHNPVDWYPWCEKAFKKAREEDKPILLSIGYSACHWCHVMEKESFENEDIASIMNRYFINIKVDREERPEIDELYQYALQLFGKRGGWPLTIFLTPEGKPFFGGTYFPPVEMGGLPGFSQILLAVARAYRERKKEIGVTTSSVEEALQRINYHEDAGVTIDLSDLNRASSHLLRLYDPSYGGFGEAPKFPSSIQLSLLLRYYKRTGDTMALDAVENTLRNMSAGGIRDHLGGGFHRYSVDERWLIPHFEKMLYDNALLSKLYMDAFRVTGKVWYKDIAEETLEYMMREMFHREGGFYSSQDADSEGEEGKFYLWTKREIESILGRDAEIVCRFYGVTEGGNFEDRNILYIDRGINALSREFGLPEKEIEEILRMGRDRLFRYRKGRAKPFRDKKIITAWNGLAISSMVDAYMVTHKKAYLEVAERSLQFIRSNLWKEGVLYHVWIDGENRHTGTLEDYSFLIQAAIDMFEATFTDKYLQWAEELTESLIGEMWDREGHVFYNAPHDDMVFYRLKTGMDQFIPSGNGVAAMNLIRLSLYRDRGDFRKMAEETIRYFYENLLEDPFNYVSLIISAYALTGIKEITVIGEEEDIRHIIRFLGEKYIPDRVIYAVIKEEHKGHTPEFADGKEMRGDKTTVYICENYTCSEPLITEEDIERYLTSH